MVQYNSQEYLPTAEELLEPDEKAVDDELQNLIPNLLLAILATIWSNRQDWFFGVDMGIYHNTDEPAIVPDGFLSLGVQRLVGEQGRLSYVIWQENGVIPILVLEVVSKTYRGEYKQKKIDYAELGVLYYVIYKPGRYHNRRGDNNESANSADVYSTKQLDGESPNCRVATDKNKAACHNTNAHF